MIARGSDLMERDKMLNVHSDRRKMNEYRAKEKNKQFYVENTYSRLFDS
jgi:hypothetical protein